MCSGLLDHVLWNILGNHDTQKHKLDLNLSNEMLNNNNMHTEMHRTFGSFFMFTICMEEYITARMDAVLQVL